MIKYYLNHLKNFILIVLITGLIFSCTPHKKLIYLQNKSKSLSEKDTVSIPKKINYRIKPNDNLYIKIVSLDPKSLDYTTSQVPSYGGNESYTFLAGYTVNDSGYIQLPIAGDIKVSSLTILEAKEKIQKSIGQYVINSTVVVKLLNFRVSVLGDVERPGTFYVYDNTINIFQAIALAGDLGPYGNSRKVKLIRVTDKGPEITALNLTDKRILYSDKYYLAPNDIIYIEPNTAAKTAGFARVPWELFISAITATLSVITTTLLILKY